MAGENTENTGAPITVDVLDGNRNAVGKIDLNPAVFDAPVKIHLLHQSVVYQEAKHRAGTADTKDRGEVAGSNRKPWKQKGTGRARSGERTSPVWRGGGITWGPHPRDYSLKMSKKARKSALRSALTAKLKEENLLVVDDLKLDKIGTKLLATWVKGLGAGTDLLVVIPAADETVELSARNLPAVKVIRAEGLNVRDVLRFKKVILTRGAAEKVQEALA